jgi:uncharacterized RDD family membrane protein YckC
MNYAGFWYRFGAFLIDWIILGILNWLIIAPILAAIGITSGMSMSDLASGNFDPEQLVAMVAAMFGIGWFVSMTLDILYHSFFESSKFQGSVGKIALGIKVTDLSGGKIDLVKAIIRNFCKIISGMILAIGYIMAGFTDKKQALHDMIASTLVVKK